MSDPYRTPGEKISKFTMISEGKILMLLGIPSVTMVVMGFIACVAIPNAIEAQNYDPTKDISKACKDSLSHIVANHSEQCDHPDHSSTILMNKDNDPKWWICKCHGLPVVQIQKDKEK